DLHIYLWFCLTTNTPLFPYTTLFRSILVMRKHRDPEDQDDEGDLPPVDGANEERSADERGEEPGQQHQRLSISSRSSSAEPSFRSEEHTSELHSPYDIVCHHLLEK